MSVGRSVRSLRFKLCADGKFERSRKLSGVPLEGIGRFGPDLRSGNSDAYDSRLGV